MKIAVMKLVNIGFAFSLFMSAWSASAQNASPPAASDPKTQQTATSANMSTTSADATAAPAEVEPSVEKTEASATDATDPEALDGETYRVRLRDLEQRVDELKEQIRRSHTRLSMLSDTILAGASGGGRAEIQFINDLSGAWHVVEAVFVLDGAVQYKKTDDTGVLAKQTTIPIFSGSVPTGDHTLQVMLKLRGHGYGVFSYLRGIEATVRASHSFTLADGKVLELKATAWEKGGPTTPVEQQPDIRFNAVTRSLSDMPKVDPISAGSTSAATTDSSKGKSGSVGVGASTGAGASGQ